MISITRYYRFDETPTTFDKLGVGSLYITEAGLSCLGDMASINMKIDTANSNKFNSICFDTGVYFNTPSSTVVYKGV